MNRLLSRLSLLIVLALVFVLAANIVMAGSGYYIHRTVPKPGSCEEYGYNGRGEWSWHVPSTIAIVHNQTYLNGVQVASYWRTSTFSALSGSYSGFYLIPDGYGLPARIPYTLTYTQDYFLKDTSEPYAHTEEVVTCDSAHRLTVYDSP